MFELVECLAEVVVGGSLVLHKGGVFLVLRCGHIQHSSKVEAGEDTVVWNRVVVGCWLKVMQVREVGGVGVT